MNFKNEYKSEFDNICVDEDFKNSLARKMNQMSPSRRNYKVYSTVLAAVAVFAVVVGVGFWHSTEGQKNIGIKTENTTTVAGSEGLFATDKWYGTAQSDEEIYGTFAKLLESGTLKTLYCAVGETFGDEDIVSTNDANDLAGKLAVAVPVGSEFAGESRNYMAVFEGGEIVKFQISDADLVKLNDADTIFKFEK